MRKLVFILAIALFILHQDWWLWADGELVLGFVPIGLAYHALFSILAGVVWALAVKFAWPSDIEAWAGVTDDAGENVTADVAIPVEGSS
jgi:hypothetical protein